MAGSPTPTSTAPDPRRLVRRTSLLAAAAAAVAVAALTAACASGDPPPDEGPFALGIVNGSRHDVTVTWTGARQGGGTVAACEVGSFAFDDGLWVVGIVGAVDAVRFPMRVETEAGGPRTRTVALDATGRIDADARVPLRDPPCPVR